MIQMPRSPPPRRSPATRASSISAPVGLPGELRMIALVLGVIAAMTRRRAPRSRPPSLRLHDHRRRAHRASPARESSASTARA